MRNSCRLLSVLILIASGCTYNPVRYDPCTGFQTGGGVGVLCGGPLDPWMLHCCPQCGSTGSCGCCPLTQTAGPCCPAPICPTPVCPSPGIPIVPSMSPMLPTTVSPMSPLPMLPAASPVMSMPAAPISGPPIYRPAPTPTFAPSCPTCGPSPSAAISGYPQTVQTPYPGVSNYPQLFNGPPMAPPAPPQSQDQFLMPAPLDESQLPPGSGPMPPHYEQMETPAGQPMPQTNPPMPPVQAPTPMQQAAPMTTQPPAQQPMPTPMPMPAGPDANQTSYPGMMVPNLTQQGVVPPQGVHYDSRRQQWIPMRL